LYSQNRKLQELDSLIENNHIRQFKTKLKEYSSDTINFNQEDKILLNITLSKFHYKKDKSELALSYLKKAENYYTKTNNNLQLANIHFEIFRILKSQENLEKRNNAKTYLDLYYKNALENNIDKNILKSYMGYASLSFTPKKIKEALNYYDKAEAISIKINDSLSLAKIYSNKGVLIKYFYKKTDSARLFYKKALKIYSTLNKNNETFNISLNISNTFKQERNFIQALKWLKKIDLIPITSNRISSKKLLYKQMSKNYDSLKDYKNSNLYLKKYLAYKDSVDIKEQNIAISDIQTKYETEKKEKDILKLKSEADKQKSYLILIAILFLSSLILGTLIYFHLKRKKDLAEKDRQLEHQKVVSLMKEQELKTLDAIVEGQEKERLRIAEDLHDNLGSKLAVLKLQFDSFIENAINNNNKEQINRFKSTSGLLEETYQSVRSMSHIESNREVQQSLIHAIRSLATNITKSNKFEIEITDFGLENPINPKIEIFTLRIIQELLTNIIKYSNAEKISIDLTLFENALGIIVSDDGIGFDLSKLKYQNKGFGLKSINDRVTKLGGMITLDSGLGNGTTVIIELPIKQNNI